MSVWPPHLAPKVRCVAEGGPGVRCPRPRSWVCAHPVLTDGKEGNAVDPRWPQARGIHSQRQTISIISASPGAIVEAALQHSVVHIVSMWLADPVHLGRGGHTHASVRSHDLMNVCMFWLLAADGLVCSRYMIWTLASWGPRTPCLLLVLYFWFVLRVSKIVPAKYIIRAAIIKIVNKEASLLLQVSHYWQHNRGLQIVPLSLFGWQKWNLRSVNVVSVVL